MLFLKQHSTSSRSAISCYRAENC